jgi:hypothetical protein
MGKHQTGRAAKSPTRRAGSNPITEPLPASKSTGQKGTNRRSDIKRNATCDSTADAQKTLRGSVLRYDDPTEPCWPSDGRREDEKY